MGESGWLVDVIFRKVIHDIWMEPFLAMASPDLGGAGRMKCGDRLHAIPLPRGRGLTLPAEDEKGERASEKGRSGPSVDLAPLIHAENPKEFGIGLGGPKPGDGLPRIAGATAMEF